MANLTNDPSLRHLTSPTFGKPKRSQNVLLQQLGLPHTTSFNYMINEGLPKVVADLVPVEFALNNDRICLKIEDISLNCPLVPSGTIGVKNPRVYPTECRQKATTYKGKCMVKVSWYVNGALRMTFDKDMGNLPIMVKSNRCNLDFMSPKELVTHGEHEDEWGGYFVIKGHERLIRMLLMVRRNYPIAIRRSGWKGRGTLFSDVGVQIRCVSDDQTATTNVLHYVTDGNAKLMFSYKKNLYYVPLVLILKCLCDYCDFYIFKKLTAGYEDDSFFIGCVQTLIRAVHVENNLHTNEECKKFLGQTFRVKMTELPDWYTDTEIADFIIQKTILIHLDKPEDKFNMLAYMAQKLYVFAQDKCKYEGVDSVMMQELLLGGHLYLQIVKEKLQDWLYRFKFEIQKKANGSLSYNLTDNEIMKMARSNGGIEKMLENFLATGNIKSKSGLGLMQDTGLTIVAENINRMRYMSHFKAAHRGAFFQEMRTTEVRQLLCDAWGFICPVHTPDGTPCGLLNHLTQDCFVTDVPDPEKVRGVPRLLVRYGMVPIDEGGRPRIQHCHTVLLDGRVLGHLPDDLVTSVVGILRRTKIEGVSVPDTLEIALVPKKDVKSQYPGLYLFTGPARMMRPLINLTTGSIENVGTFEQVYLDVAVTPKEFYQGVTTHMEISKTSFLSNLSKLIPMPDANQSPRNMYQCQMGKQTMGTPCHNWNLQAETKLYRLHTPASPLFRPVHYDDIELDDFAMGTNAIIAVLSDTGYDMEDAMIINKASEERGMFHATVYKTEFIDPKHMNSYFCRDPTKPDLVPHLETDGLPFIGRKVNCGEPIYCYFDAENSVYVVGKYRGKEQCFVNSVRLFSDVEARKYKVACITFRVPRNPSIGDKFASRAGQKGICSQKWPMADLPFSESGVVPDIVFNPHGFPSRMTIAMMLELMAGKSAAVHGLVHDATPFKFSEETTAKEYFEKMLEAGGYNYQGTETMYSGTTGEMLEMDIFFGIVYYQRLRHMVSDKWQVRSTGPMDAVTRQPLKGRKRGGGVRFGEMERDALISHGSPFLLNDRLLHNSDAVKASACVSCLEILSPSIVITRLADKPHLSKTREVCQICRRSENVIEIRVPYMYLYFIKEALMMNIKLQAHLKHV